MRNLQLRARVNRLLMSQGQLPSEGQTLESLKQRTSSLLETFPGCNAHELGSQAMAALLQRMALMISTASQTVDGLVDQQDEQESMLTAVRLFEGVGAWVLQQGEPLQQMGVSMCRPLTLLLDQALLLIHHATFNRRWLQVLGSAPSLACSSGLRGVVKDLAVLSQSLIAGWWTGLEEAEKANEALQDLQGFTTCLARRLMDLGVTASEAMLLRESRSEALAMQPQHQPDPSSSSSSSTTSLPPEAVVAATLNLAWNTLQKLVTGLPRLSLPSLIDAQLAAEAISHSLHYVDCWFRRFLRPPHDAAKLKLVRFWTMQLYKLVLSHALCDSAIWKRLCDVSLALYAALASRRPCGDEEDSSPGASGLSQILSDLEQHVAPKLAQLVVMCLDELHDGDAGHAETALQAVALKLSLLTQRGAAAAGEQWQQGQPDKGGGSRGSAPGSSSSSAAVTQAGPQALAHGRMLLFSEVLHRAPLMGSAALLATARELPAVMDSVVVSQFALYSSSVGRSDRGGGDVASLLCSGVVALSAACSAKAAASGNDGERADRMKEAAWNECSTVLYSLGCSAHPGLQHLAASSLASIVSCCPPALAAQQLCELGQLVEELSAAEAVGEAERVVAAQGSAEAMLANMAAAGSTASTAASDCVLLVGLGACSSAACTATSLLCTLTKAAPQAASSRALSDLQLDSRHLARATADLGSMLAAARLCSCFDAESRGAADVASWLEGLTARVQEGLDIFSSVSDDPQLAALASAQLSAVLLLLDLNLKHAQQAMSAARDAEPAASCAQPGRAGGLEHLSAREAETVGLARAPAVAAAAEILSGWAAAGPASGHHQQQEQALQGCAPSPGPSAPLHVLWALRVVARAGDLLPMPVLSELLPALMALRDQPSCAVHVAAAAAFCGPLNPPPSALFHSLLRSQLWPLLHEALLSLVSAAKTCTGSDFRVFIPQELFAVAPGAEGGPPTFKLGREYRDYVVLQTSPAQVESALRSADTAANGRAMEVLAALPQAAEAGPAAAACSARVNLGLQCLEHLCQSATAASHACASALPQPQQRRPCPSQQQQQQQQGPQSLLAQLLPQNKAHIAAATQAMKSLETSLMSIHAAAHSGTLFRSQAAGSEDRAMLHAHTSFLLAELASANSKVRTLQDLVHAMR